MRQKRALKPRLVKVCRMERVQTQRALSHRLVVKVMRPAGRSRHRASRVRPVTQTNLVTIASRCIW